MASKNTQHWLARAVAAEQRVPEPNWRAVSEFATWIAFLDNRDARLSTKPKPPIDIDEGSRAPWEAYGLKENPRDDQHSFAGSMEAAQMLGSIGPDDDTEKE